MTETDELCRILSTVIPCPLHPVSPNSNAPHGTYTLQLLNENTTANVESIAKLKLPAYPAHFTEGEPIAHRIWRDWIHYAYGAYADPGYSYKRVQFRWEWEEGTDPAARHPVEVLVVFSPEDDPDTPDENESETQAEIIGSPIKWDGKGEKSEPHELDPDTLKSGTQNGTFWLMEVAPTAPVIYMFSAHDRDVVELSVSSGSSMNVQWKLKNSSGAQGQFQNDGKSTWETSGTSATVKFRAGKNGAGNIAGHTRAQAPGTNTIQLLVNGTVCWEKPINVLEIINRAAWGAYAADLSKLSTTPSIQGITFHHSSRKDDGAAEVLRIQDMHMQISWKYWAKKGNGWGDIGYHFIMDKSGNIYQGRELEGAPGISKGPYTLGSHVQDNNTLAGIGVCVLGNYEGVESFSTSQQASLESILTAIARRYNLDCRGISYHQARATTNPTECPGSNIISNAPIIIKNVEKNLQ